MQIYNKRMHTYLDQHQMKFATNAKNAILNANICRSIFTRNKSQACGKKLCKSWICCSSCFFEVGGTSTNLTSCWDCVNTHHTCTRAARAHTHTHTHSEKLWRQKQENQLWNDVSSEHASVANRSILLTFHQFTFSAYFSRYSSHLTPAKIR